MPIFTQTLYAIPIAMKSLIFSTFLISVISSCEQKGKEVSIIGESKVTIEMETEEYSLDNSGQGIDSDFKQLKYILSEDSISITIWSGCCISNLTESEPIIIYEEEIYNQHKEKGQLKNNWFYHDPREQMDLDKYLLQNVKFDTIAGYEVKIISPRSGRNGLYAYHFYNLDSEGSVDLKLNLMSYDLNTVQQSEFDRLVHSLKVLPK
jgi:hypothetical protein